jgi:hypothetical protein
VPKSVFFQHHFLDNLLNKQGFYRSPEQKDEAINFASLSRFQELYGDDAAYAPGVPLPARAYQLTQNITDKLQPFLRELLVVRPSITFPADQLGDDFDRPVYFVSNNKFLLPDGWVHPVAMHFIESVDGLAADMGNYLYPHADVKVLNDDKGGRRRRSKIVAPTQSYPIAVVAKDGYRVLPLPEGLLYVKYLGLPPKSLFAYTLDDDGQIVYNDTDSVDNGWPEIEQNDILMKAAELLGVPLQDAQLMQFARSKAQTGA